MGKSVGEAPADGGPSGASLAHAGMIVPRFIMQEHLCHLMRRQGSPMIRAFMQSAGQ